MKYTLVIRYAIVNSETDFAESLITDCIADLKNSAKLINCIIYDKSTQYWHIKAEYKSDTFYFIEFSLSANGHSKQVHIKIYPQREKSEYDTKLEEIKITIKKYLLKNWNKSRCYWIEDKQVLQLSEKLYPKINTAENLLRSFINTVMENSYGISWWDNYIPYKMKDKYSARKAQLKRCAPSFNDVVDNLLSIDVDDLMEILTLKVEEWSPQISEPIEIAIKKNEQNKLLELLKKQMIVKKDLWSEEFQNYFDSTFLDSWKEFCVNRNHIAHNKPVDNIAYKKFTENVDKVIKDINSAREKYEIALTQKALLLTGQSGVTPQISTETAPEIPSGTEPGAPEGTAPEIPSGTEPGAPEGAAPEIPSGTEPDAPEGTAPETLSGTAPDTTAGTSPEDGTEESDEDDHPEYDEYNWEEAEREIMEAEANIKILDSDEILNILEEAVEGICTEIEDKYYFRQDLEIKQYGFGDEECSLMDISSKLNDKIIELKTITLINDSMGDTSTLELQIIFDEEVLCKSFIEYVNGEAEFNHDQGYYMPIRENELIMPNLEEFYECLDNQINEAFPNLLEEAESINSSRVRDGGSPVTADIPCDECGEEGISIDEDFFEYGKCVCCGASHNIKECIRCGCLFTGSGELCENCEAYIREQ